jgi:hypothetical protein
MDLARYSRCYQDEHLSTVINDAVAFVDMNDILTHWGEDEGSKYAVGFWAEALYHFYLLAPTRDKLSKLAGVICKIEEIGVGLPPSLFGANAEAVPLRDQTGCLSPSDGRIKVANLSRKDRVELLVVNPTTIPLQLSWETPTLGKFAWESPTGDPIENESNITIPARSWIVGHQQLTELRRNLSAITMDME